LIEIGTEIRIEACVDGLFLHGVEPEELIAAAREQQQQHQAAHRTRIT
jgi:hypothetical protein